MNERSERIRQVIEGYSRRRAAGENISDESIISGHVDLMPELEDALRALDLVGRAWEIADERIENQSHPEKSGVGELRIRCPHCHNPIEILDDTPLTDIPCSSCGSHFSLVDEDADPTHAGVPRTIGHFEMIEHLGTGAFGSVWKAHDSELNRMVALKIPRKRQGSAAESDQFLREARTAAQLRHPHIVPVHEVGRDGDTIYIVSDFVDGVSLDQRLKDHQPTVLEAAHLCAMIANALQHAHENGVIHRDLKPSNIMIDDLGKPHLLDFGLAKRETSEITMTLDGKLLGTPAYMPPEQAKGESHTADARSDIYALGVIFFELLTGELPFRGGSRMLLQQVIHDDPPSPRKFCAVPRDAETICLKCMEKEPAKRYPNAEELADDFIHLVSGEPIKARPIGTLALAWRWCRRKPIAAALIGVSALAISAVAALIVGSVFYGQLQVALTGEADAKKTVENLLTTEARVRQEKEAALQMANSNLYRFGVASAERELLRGNISAAKRRLSDCLPQFRGWEWDYLTAQCNDQLLTLQGANIDGAMPGLRPHCASFNRDGTLLALTSGDSVVLWNVVKRKTEQLLTGHEGQLNCAIFSPDGQRLASAGADGVARIWDVRTGKLLVSYTAHRMPIFDMAFSPDGARIASTAFDMRQDSEFRIWDSRSGSTLFQSAKDAVEVFSLAFSLDGQTLATVCYDGIVRLRNGKTGEIDAEFSNPDWKAVQVVQLTPDNQKVISACGRKGQICMWEIETKEMTVLANHDHIVNSLAISPDGRFLASGGFDRKAKVWDLQTGQQISEFGGHAVSVICVAYDPRSEQLLTRDAKGDVKFWNTGTSFGAGSRLNIYDYSTRQIDRSQVILNDENHELPSIVSLGGHVVEACFSGNSLLTAHMPSVQESTDYTPAFIHDSETGIGELIGTGYGAMSRAKFSPDRTRLATITSKRRLYVWDLKTRKELFNISQPIRGAFIGEPFDWSADGQQIALILEDETVCLYEVATGKQQRVFEIPKEEQVYNLASQPNANRVAVIGNSNLFIFDGQTGALLRTIKWSASDPIVGVNDLEFSQDGERLAAGCVNGNILLFDLTKDQLHSELIGHTGIVSNVKFSADGKRLFSGSIDKSVKVWDVTSGQEALTLPFDAPINAVALNEDGQKLAAVGFSEIRVWDTRPSEAPIHIFDRLGDGVKQRD